MTAQITVTPAGLKNVGKTIFDAGAILEALRPLYPKPSTRKGELTLGARIRLAETDGVITSNEAQLLRIAN
jgi:hypothetical protein